MHAMLSVRVHAQLSYIMRDSETVPVHLVPTYGSQVVRLDLSENRLRFSLCLLHTDTNIHLKHFSS